MSKHFDGKLLRAQLERAAIRDRDLDREVAADWVAVDTDAWKKLDIAKPGHKAVDRDAAKSTSRRSTQR